MCIRDRASAAITWCGERSTERTKLVGAKCFGFDLLTVGIHQLNVNRTVGNGFVVVGALVVGNANAFELNRLSRPINRAISKEDRLFADAVGIVVSIEVSVRIETKRLVFVLNENQLIVASIFHCLVGKFIHALIVGRGIADEYFMAITAILIPAVDGDLGTADWIAASGIEYLSLDFAIFPSDDVQVADPHVGC